MATVNLGSIKFKWKGTYSGATAYTIDDVVEYNGSSYICISNSTGNLPTNATYFEQMSSAGTNGTNGTDVGTVITTQGDILYRDGSGLQRLGAGTSGQFLKTLGTGANPAWSDVTAGLVGFAHAVQPNTTNINSTSFVSTGLSVNYTPVDYANNRIFVLLAGQIDQDDADSAYLYYKVAGAGSHSITLADEPALLDLAQGRAFGSLSLFAEDTGFSSNTQQTYTLYGRTDNATSDFRPHLSLTLSVFEIGV